MFGEGDCLSFTVGVRVERFGGSRFALRLVHRSDRVRFGRVESGLR